jgi:putative redox protein
MANAKVTWTSSRTFIGVDSSQHSVVMSSEKDGIGMKPSELLLVALGACSSYDVVSILEKRKKTLEKLEVEVTAEQEEEAPWTFRKIHLKYILKGAGLEGKDVGKAIELSEGKYCSVAATLKGKAEITWDYVLEE